MTDNRKAKIARLRKIVKAVCSSLRVRRGCGTAGAWVEILSGNVGAEFSDREKVALNHLGIPRVANSASIAPEDLDATLRWLEDRGYGAKVHQPKPEPKAEFTPGPWEVVQCLPEIFVCQIARNREAETICSIDYHDEVAFANAHLIAAAPTQNDVLKELAARIETCEPCDGTGLEPDDPENACGICGGQGRVLTNCTGLITEIEEAIKKATEV